MPLQSQILGPHSKVLVADKQDIKASLEAIEDKLNLSIEYFQVAADANGLRDQTFVMNDGRVFRIDQSIINQSEPYTQASLQILRHHIQKRWKPPLQEVLNFTELVGGQALLLSSHYSSNFSTLPKLFLEGGNVLVFGHHVFVGGESLKLFELFQTQRLSTYFSTMFPGNHLHIIPQILWHLDMFALLVAPHFVLLPLLPSSDDIAKMTGQKQLFYRYLKTQQSALTKAKVIFESAGLQVRFINGYHFDDTGDLAAAYFNGLTGLNHNKQPYILMTNFHQKYNRLFQLELRLVGISVKVYFIGDPSQNYQRLVKSGKSLKCLTSC